MKLSVDEDTIDYIADTTKGVIDHFFGKAQEFLNNNLKQIGDTFGHELALAFKNVLENSTVIVSGDMKIDND